MAESGMERTRRFLEGMGLPRGDQHDLPNSPQRFADGGQWRVEIPSVEGPNALRAVFDTADELGVPVHRVSQGSGVMLLTDAELDEMHELAEARGIEVSLFVGPRAGWDTGAMAYSTAGRIVAPKVRGADQLVQAVEDVRRACEHGIESVLVTDEGLLEVLGEMRRAGELPLGLILKGSVMLGAANPVSVRNLERLGLTTFNVPTDLSLAQLAAIRAATTMPLDIYIEVPDDIGGFIRHYEIAEIVRVTAPVYLKFGLRNAPNLERVLPPDVRARVTAVQQTLTIDQARNSAIPTTATVMAVGAAVHEGRRLFMRYASAASEETERRVDPYGLVHMIGRWYAPGFCHLRANLRLFRLDRIREVTVLDESFARPIDFDPLTFVQEALAVAPNVWQVEAVVQAPLEKVREVVAAHEAMLESIDDGVVIRLNVEVLDAAARYLIGLGWPFCVRQPAELRAVLRSLAIDISAAAAEPSDANA